MTVTRELEPGPDGRRYFKIIESDTGVPEDELEFNNGGNYSCLKKVVGHT